MEWKGVDWKSAMVSTDEVEASLTGPCGIGTEIQCPLCHDVIMEARVSVRCLHRFCKDCIERTLETCESPEKRCPVCHISFNGDRDLREDRRFDNLIALWHVSPPSQPILAGGQEQHQKIPRKRQQKTTTATKWLKTHKERAQRPSAHREHSETDRSVSLREKEHAHPQHKRQKKGNEKSKDAQQKEKVVGNYGTSLRVILKPMASLSYCDDLIFNLQKDTSMNTVRELVRGHMYRITDDVGFERGKVNFYIRYEENNMTRPVTDYSSRIGVLHGTILRHEPSEQLVFMMAAFISVFGTNFLLLGFVLRGF